MQDSLSLNTELTLLISVISSDKNQLNFKEGGMKMRKLFVALAVSGLSVALTAPVFCDEPEDYGRRYGYGWACPGGWR
jgi:hypothetical protein